MPSLRCLVVLLALLPLTAQAETFPRDAGALNARDFGAKGNGQDDDTAALLRAIAASGEDTRTRFWQDRIVFLPNGVYRVSASLLKRYQSGGFGSGLILLGESRDRTIIRLADHAPGFQDPAHPQAVIFTTSKQIDGTPTSGGKNYVELGEGNDAYMNFIETMTIDVGTGNTGAIALDFLGNNLGAIRNVTLHANPGSGAIGLSMMRKWPGPTFVQNLDIQGFAIGIATAQTEYGLTFEHIRLKDQSVAAIRNNQNALTLRDLEISGPMPNLINQGEKGFIAIDGGRSPAAGLAGLIHNSGVATFRNFHLTDQTLTGVLQGADHWTPTTLPSWLRPDSNPPVEPSFAPDKWISPARFGASGDPAHDATEALQQAANSGAAVLYLPHGTYAISDRIDIPASVQRIVGMNSTITAWTTRKPGFSRTGGMVRSAASGAPLVIERLAFDHSNRGDQLAIELTGERDVTIRDVVSAGVTLLDRSTTGGRVFLEDVCCGRMRIAGPNPVFARQLDTEGAGIRIANQGSPLFILGLKTEGLGTIVDNRAGAHTDIFGGLLYLVRDGADPTIPAFRNSGSSLSVSLVEESLRSASHYQVYVGRDPNDPKPAIPATDFPARGLGRFIPALVDGPN
jgi:hypothetical protein